MTGLNLRDLRLRARALFAPRRAERDLDDELAFHLEQETRKLVDGGMTAAEGRATALARFGSIAAVADDCRDARGTAFVDATIRDIVYALRGFSRAPLVTLAIVSTVALGLGLVAVVFSFLNAFLFRVDQVPTVDDMFALERPQTSGDERGSFTRAHLDAIRRDTNVFSDAYAELSGIDFPVDGRTVSFTLTTGNFFHVVGVRAAIGRELTPADDDPAVGHPVMVLSDRGWDRLFARDPAAVGRSVLVKGVSYEIVGVMPRGFRGLSVVPPDYWLPLAMIDKLRPTRGGDPTAGVRIVGRLQPGMSRDSALAGLAVWAATSSGSFRTTSKGDSAARITLVPWRGTVPQRLEAMLVTGPLFFAFGLILVIACANVANLLLARGVARQREIGIRLSLGAARSRIVRQLLTESLLLALLAAAAGFAISRLALEVIVHAVMSSWPPEIGDMQLVVPDADWRVLLFLLTGAVVSTMCFGIVPALQATRLQPIRTMRGEVVMDARPGRTRNFLIGMQVSAAALLLICAAVFLRSALASATADPGIRTSDTVMIGIANEGTRNAIVQAVTEEPSVAALSAMWPGGLSDGRAVIAEAVSAKATVAYRLVSPEFFSVLDIPVVRGRAFAKDERAPTHSVAIVSETTARTLWPNGDAIGQVVHLERDRLSETQDLDGPPFESRSFTVVGVARDVAGFRIARISKAVIYLPTSAATRGTLLVARVYGDPERARQTLLNRLTTIDPNMEEVGPLRWVIRMETYFLQLGFWLTVGLGGLALVLTLSGLFSVLSYLVAQRTKEIGVRMALGATTMDVTRLVLSQSTRPVGIGLVIGGGSVAGLSALLLATPAAATIGELVDVTDPVAYVASLLVIMAACLAAASIPAVRAARLDPMRTLREE
jgi:predicted permease